MECKSKPGNRHHHRKQNDVIAIMHNICVEAADKWVVQLYSAMVKRLMCENHESALGRRRKMIMMMRRST